MDNYRLSYDVHLKGKTRAETARNAVQFHFVVEFQARPNEAEKKAKRLFNLAKKAYANLGYLWDPCLLRIIVPQEIQEEVHCGVRVRFN